MRRHAGRLAQTTVRGLLLLGGLVAALGAYEAIMGGPAYADDKPRPSVVGSLLGDAGALINGVLPSPSAGPLMVDCGMDEAEARCEPASESPATTGTSAPGRVEPVVAVRVPPSDRSPAAPPLPRVADREAGSGLARVVGAVAPVTRPVVEAAAPAVQGGIAGAGALEPVDVVVRPAAEPIVEILSPVLVPVLEVTRPIIGQLTYPVVAPDEPQCGPVEALPGTTPGTGGAARTPAVAPTHPHAAPPALHRNVSLERWSRGEPADGAFADLGRGRGRTGGMPSGGLTPAASGSANSSSSSGAGTPTAADISPRSWTPELMPQRCGSSRWETFTERSSQPDTRPA